MNRNGIVSLTVILIALFTWSVRPSQADNSINWNHYGLPFESIVTLDEDAQGNLWVGSLFSGAAMFDGQTWTTFNNDNGLIENTVQSIAFSSDVTFLGHWHSGLTILKDGQKTELRDDVVLQSGNVSEITVLENGDIWLGHAATSTMMSGGGVTHISAESTKTYDFVGDTTSNALKGISADADDNIWFAVSDYVTRVTVETGGLVKFDGTEWTTYTVADGLPSTDVQALVIDGNTVWVSTPEGITSFDGTTWTTYTTDDGLLSNVNTAIVIDGNGTVWTISENGVNYFADGAWNTLTSADGLLDDIVTAIAVDNAGNIMFASESGISQMQTANAQPEQHQIFMPIVIK